MRMNDGRILRQNWAIANKLILNGMEQKAQCRRFTDGISDVTPSAYRAEFQLKARSRLRLDQDQDGCRSRTRTAGCGGSLHFLTPILPA